MKLLAVVAIGVTALIGSPTTGAAKSERLTNSCGALLKQAEASWLFAQIFQKRREEIAKQPGIAKNIDKFEEELTRITSAETEQLEIVATYAQIYAAFCK